jgi:xanthine/CO dehydrogenase XdhC/CoxF family maturation factor
MSDDVVYRAIVEAAGGGRPAVLATVVATRGSVPRHAGSRMLIRPGEGLVGTIGGGCGEADVLAAAEQVLAEGVARLVRVELLDAIDSWSPAVCGGIMEVLLEPLAAGAGEPAGEDAGELTPHEADPT